jgi:hypothetical protein
MKKLFQSSAFALLFLGYFASSCEKAKVGPAAAVAVTPRAIQFKSIYTPNGGNNQTIVSGDTVTVAIGTFIRIEPQLPDSIKKCNGTWTQTVAPPMTNDDYSAVKDLKTGVVNFIPKKPGTFTINFTYTCPGKPPYTASIIIIVK